MLAVVLSGAGFRGDGSARYPGATPPPVWSASGPAVWRTPLATWSNASPTLFGSLVCSTEEPVAVVCLDKATGKVRWRVVNDVVSTLPAAEQAGVRARVEAFQALEATLPGLLQEQSAIRRELRSSAAAPDAVARLEQVTQRVYAIHGQRTELGRYLTPADKDQIGWATPTPVTDGRSLWVLFGNGVVARFEADGTRTWARWLGEPPTDPMNGYSFGTTASPLLVDGVLVVGFRDLVGLDPATGATRWTVPRYRDYGTPAVATVAGQKVLLTPDGRAVRPRDGKLLATGLPATWFNTVDVVGADVYVAASMGRESPREFTATRYTLVAAGADAVRAQVVWTTKQASQSRVYATPIVHRGRLLVVDDNGTLYGFDAATGAPDAPQKLPTQGKGHYAGLVLVGDRVLVANESGGTAWIDVGTATVATPAGASDGYRCTPVAEGARLYVRTLKGMVALGR